MPGVQHASGAACQGCGAQGVQHARGVARLGDVATLLGVVEDHRLGVALDLERLECGEGEVGVALARDLARVSGRG